MQLTNQKRLAAKILKCGENRVWINPDYIDEIASSVQADDIREFIEEGLIRAKAVKGTSRVRAVLVKNSDVKVDRRDKVSEWVQQMLVTLVRIDGCVPSGHNDVLSRICERLMKSRLSIPTLLSQGERWNIPFHRPHAFSNDAWGVELKEGEN